MISMELLRTTTLIAATLTVGLMAGLYFAFIVSVMPGLARVDDRAFVVTMQRINVAIINGWFLLAFLGGLVFTALAAALHLGAADRRLLPWLVAAFLLYAATIVTTRAVNIPLNNELMAAGDPATITDFAAVRTRFEATWVRWNVARGLAALASFACMCGALLRH
jgi:uncharacterized membrane protein